MKLSLWGEKLRSKIDLLGKGHLSSLNDLTELDGEYVATGEDPYLIFKLDAAGVRGAIRILLDIETIEGAISPRIYYRARGRWRQGYSAGMRHIGGGNYSLCLIVASRLTAIRLDPAERACRFRIRRFYVEPISDVATRHAADQGIGAQNLSAIAMTFASRLLGRNVVIDPFDRVQPSAPLAKWNKWRTKHWPWGEKLRSDIDLLATGRLSVLNHLTETDGVYTSEGRDPYLVFDLGEPGVRGPMLLELEITPLEGRLFPRVYFQRRGRWTQGNSVVLRRADGTHYQIHLLIPGRLRKLRLDPAERACRFRIRRFVLKPVSLSLFLRRVTVMGLDDREVQPDYRLLWPMFKHLIRRHIAFEAPAGARLRGDQTYAQWIATYDYDRVEAPALKTELAARPDLPRIAVVMPVYNTPPRLLNEAIASVVGQIYENWELCIADDCSTAEWVRPLLAEWAARDSRIKVIYRSHNGHISEATNSAFELVTSDFVALLDHDDLLAPNALAEVALAVSENPDAQIIYSDEDKINDHGHRFDPFFKPEWNPLLFMGQNYFNHLTVHRSANIRQVGGWRHAFVGSQDYDLNLRVVAHTGARNIVHIPKVLYHWRATETSVARKDDQKDYAIVSARNALTEYLQVQGLPGHVETVEGHNWNRVRFSLPDAPPLVSLIIPTRNSHDVLRVCIDSIREKTTYSNYEIIVVDNGSDHPESLRYFCELEYRGVARILRYDKPFNYSAINNFAVAHARGELVGLINNDMEVISPGWLDEIVSLALLPGTGCVGAKLYYPNETIQHAGVILGLGGVAGHSHKHAPRIRRGYFGRLHLVQNISAVTAACLIVRKSIYEEVGGLDADNLAVAFNDVDFCLRVTQAGYTNAWTPHAELYHHESLSRGSEDSPEKQKRFEGEVLYMKARWGDKLMRDPYYSPNLTLRREDFSIGLD